MSEKEISFDNFQQLSKLHLFIEVTRLMSNSMLPVWQKFLDLWLSLSFPDVQTFGMRHDLHYSTSHQTSALLASPLQSFVGQQLAAVMTSWDTSGKTPHAFAPEAQILCPLCVSM